MHKAYSQIWAIIQKSMHNCPMFTTSLGRQQEYIIFLEYESLKDFIDKITFVLIMSPESGPDGKLWHTLDIEHLIKTKYVYKNRFE